MGYPDCPVAVALVRRPAGWKQAWGLVMLLVSLGRALLLVGVNRLGVLR